MKTFNILPTSPDFQNLTSPQKDFIWHSYLADNPKLRNKINNVHYDDDFNQEWDSLEPTDDADGAKTYSEGDKASEDERLAEMARNAYEELQKNDETKMTPAKERMQQMNTATGDVDDWQEEDDD